MIFINVLSVSIFADKKKDKEKKVKETKETIENDEVFSLEDLLNVEIIPEGKPADKKSRVPKTNDVLNFLMGVKACISASCSRHSS